MIVITCDREQLILDTIEAWGRTRQILHKKRYKDLAGNRHEPMTFRQAYEFGKRLEELTNPELRDVVKKLLNNPYFHQEFVAVTKR